MGWWGGAGVDEDAKLDRAETTALARRTAVMVRPYRGRALLSFLLLVVFSLTTMAGPLLVRRAIDEGLIAEQADQLNLSIALYIASAVVAYFSCLLYTSPSPRDATLSRMPSSA